MTAIRRPFCVGLTGGIGAGKSTVSTLFADLGVAIVDTDLISRTLTQAGGEAIPAIVATFGPDSLDEEGALDRSAMRQLVFADPDSRHRLERILHPLIREEAETALMQATSAYVVLVVPLLVENLSSYRGLLDRIAVVDCEEPQQLARTAARPGLARGVAQAILASQVPRQKRLTIADDVIDNSGDIVSLRSRIFALDEVYSRLAADRKTLDNSLP